MDLLQYLPDDSRSWIQSYIELVGMERLTEYYDKVFIELYEMLPGESFRVLEKVSPENYSCLCEFDLYDICSYYIEEQGTVILRR